MELSIVMFDSQRVVTIVKSSMAWKCSSNYEGIDIRFHQNLYRIIIYNYIQTNGGL